MKVYMMRYPIRFLAGLVLSFATVVSTQGADETFLFQTTQNAPYRFRPSVGKAGMPGSEVTWNFGDGTTNIADIKTNNPDHAYNFYGIKNVSFAVSDSVLNVTNLDFSGQRMVGPLPPNFGVLSNLTTLRLRNNAIEMVAANFSSMSGLVVIDLANNRFSGNTVFGIKPALEIFDVSGNQLSGAPYAITVDRSQQLRIYNVSSNKFTGILPEVNSRALTVMDVSYNQFSGGLLLPAVANNIQRVRANDNNLTTYFVTTVPVPNLLGTVPSPINLENKTQLIELQLQNNNFPSAEIDKILAALVTNAMARPNNYPSCYVDLRGPNNGQPGTSGQQAVTNLVKRGWTVKVNGGFGQNVQPDAALTALPPLGGSQNLPITFDAYQLGNLNGQPGDANTMNNWVVDASVSSSQAQIVASPSRSGNALQIINSAPGTGSFFDVESPRLVAAGERGSTPTQKIAGLTNSSTPVVGGNRFIHDFWFRTASSTPESGLYMNFSMTGMDVPQGGSRMTFFGLRSGANNKLKAFYTAFLGNAATDPRDPGFAELPVADLDYGTWYHVKIIADFYEGPGNDIVYVFLGQGSDPELKLITSTWEDYYRTNWEATHDTDNTNDLLASVPKAPPYVNCVTVSLGKGIEDLGTYSANGIVVDDMVLTTTNRITANEPPLFTLAAKSITVERNWGETNSVSLITGISAGSVVENLIQHVDFEVAVDPQDQGKFEPHGQPRIVLVPVAGLIPGQVTDLWQPAVLTPTANLVFIPASNQVGTAKLRITAKDKTLGLSTLATSQTQIVEVNIAKETTETKVTDVTIQTTFVDQEVPVTARVFSHQSTVNQGQVLLELFKPDTSPTGISTTVNVVNGIAAGKLAIPERILPGTYTLKATYQDAAGGYETSNNGGTATFTVNPSNPFQLIITQQPQSSVTAGVVMNEVTVEIRDEFGNVVTTDTTTSVTAARVGSGASLQGTKTVTADHGVAHFTNLKHQTAESIQISFSVAGLQSAVSTPVVVNPAAASQILLSGITSPVVAGATQNLKITLKDQFSNIASNASNTLKLTFSDPAVVAPATRSFSGADHGEATVAVQFRTAAASSSLVVSNMVNNSFKASTSVQVLAAAPSQLTLANFPSSTVAGESHSVTATILDAFNNIVDAYAGTVTLTSTDSKAVLPAAYSFGAADHGTKAFNAVLKTSGSQTLSAAATTSGSPLNASVSAIAVAPAATSKLKVEKVQAPTDRASQGVSFDVKVTPQDQFDNTTPAYRGRIHFASTDSATGSTVPADYRFSSTDESGGGFHVFSGAGNTTLFNTVGSQQLTATDTAAPSITGSLSLPVISRQFILTMGAAALTAGGQTTVTVEVRDLNFALIRDFTGNIKLSSSDPKAEFNVSSYDFRTTDQGKHTFAVKFKTAGTQTVTVTDSANNTTWKSANVTVNPAAASSLQLTGAATSQAGAALALTVTAVDAHGNTAAGYRGTVTFTSTDAAATLPANYTFVAGDNGTHAFSTAVLKTAGARTVTAKDAANSALTSTLAVSVTPGAPAKLTIQQQPPAGADVNSTFNPAPVVAIRDAFDNLVDSDNSTDVQVAATGASGALVGPTVAKAAGGLATFGGLAFDSAGTIQLVFTSGTLAAATSSQIVVLTYEERSSTDSLIIRDLDQDSGRAEPYPATIDVTGLRNQIVDVAVTLHGFTHQYMSDVNLLLVSPENKKVLLMGGAGGANAVNGLELTFSDKAAGTIPDRSAVVSGAYKPSVDPESASVDFPPEANGTPAPTAPFAESLASLVGSNPNGTWKLYVFDGVSGFAGEITDGWTLSIASTGNFMPTISSIDDLESDEGQSVETIVEIGDTETDPDSLVVSWQITQGANLISSVDLSTTGNFRILTINPVPFANGTAKFKVTVTDADGGTASSSFNYVIHSVNDRPTATPLSGLSIPEENLKVIALGGTDPDTNALTAKITSLPLNGKLYQYAEVGGNPDPGAEIAAGGTVSDSSGRVIYKGAQDYNGDDSFEFTVTDNDPLPLESDPASVGLTVTPVNDAPTLAAIGDKTVVAGNRVSFRLAGADPHDTPENNLTYTLVSITPDPGSPQPALGSVSGSFAWTPSASQVSTTPYTLVFRVTDDGTTAGASDPKSATQTMHITVEENTTITATDTTSPSSRNSNLSGQKMGPGFVLTYFSDDIGAVFMFESSQDLQHWSSLASEANLSGVVEVIDPGSGATDARFYRVRKVELPVDANVPSAPGVPSLPNLK